MLLATGEEADGVSAGAGGASAEHAGDFADAVVALDEGQFAVVRPSLTTLLTR